MNNYPPNFDNSRVELPNTDDLCEQCNQGQYEIQYWWKDGNKLEPTGDVECTDCGHIEHGTALI